MKNINLNGSINICKAEQRSMQESILDNVLSFDRLRDEIASFLEEKEFKRDLVKFGQELTTMKACYRWVQYGNLACYCSVIREDLKSLFGCTDNELDRLVVINYFDDISDMYFKLYGEQIYHIVMQDNDLLITQSDIFNHAEIDDNTVYAYIKDFYTKNHCKDFQSFKNNYKYLLNKNKKNVFKTTIDFINFPYLDFETHKQWEVLATFYNLSKDELFNGIKEQRTKNLKLFNVNLSDEDLEDKVLNVIEQLFCRAISQVLFNMYQQKEW